LDDRNQTESVITIDRNSQSGVGLRSLPGNVSYLDSEAWLAVQRKQFRAPLTTKR
jgi:hypothetical protein